MKGQKEIQQGLLQTAWWANCRIASTQQQPFLQPESQRTEECKRTAIYFSKFCKQAPETITNQIKFHKIYKYTEEHFFLVTCSK